MKPSSLSRRSFCSTLTAASLAAAQSMPTAGPLKARVKIDTERVIGEIDPKIYGNFVEHLGRCIEGGMFEEGSPLVGREGLSARMCFRDEESERHAASLARWKLCFELPLARRHRSSRPAAAPVRDGVGHCRKQPVRHPRVPEVRSHAGDGAVLMREPRHRDVGRSAAVGGIRATRPKTRR